MATETTPFLEKLKIKEVNAVKGRVFVETESGSVVNLATLLEYGETIFVLKKMKRNKMTSWKPTQDRVLVQVDPEVSETPSGLIVAGGDDRPTFDTGTIVSVGQITPFIGSTYFGEIPHADIKPGRRAVFYKESGYPLPIESDESDLYVVLNINDIYFVSDNPSASVRAY
jgi:co-chaperonin GroES (HSP10)